MKNYKIEYREINVFDIEVTADSDKHAECLAQEIIENTLPDPSHFETNMKIIERIKIEE